MGWDGAKKNTREGEEGGKVGGWERKRKKKGETNLGEMGRKEKRSTRLKAANDDSVRSLHSFNLGARSLRTGRGRAHVTGSLLVYSHETQLRSLSIYPSASALFPVPPMSSKRGRKRNDNLPPNRARDVQRAFRARRAAHLEVRTSSLFQTLLHIRLSHALPDPFFLLTITQHANFKLGPRASRRRVGGRKW